VYLQCLYTLAAQRLAVDGRPVGTRVALEQKSWPIYAASSAGSSVALVAACDGAGADASCDSWLFHDQDVKLGESLAIDFVPRPRPQ